MSVSYLPLEEEEESNFNGAYKRTWRMKDIPAFRGEEYFGVLEDNLSKVEFQLVSYKLPNSSRKNVALTWEDIDSDFLEDEDFGKQLNKKKLTEKITSSLNLEGLNELEKITILFDYVKENYLCEEFYGARTKNGIKKTIELATGNCADLNLLLINLLGSAGIKAKPILLSTRNHGLINTQMPSVYAFNYVICCAIVGENAYLLDATEDILSIGQLPYRCANHTARLLTEEGGVWIDITPKNGYKSSFNFVLSLNSEKQSIEGDFGIFMQGLEEIHARRMLLESNEESYLKEEGFDESVGFIEYKIENAEDLSSPLSVTGRYQKTQELLGNLIYIDAFLHKTFEENPFKKEERVYPVNLGTPINESYYLSIEIPEGYVVEEIPESINLNLPHKGGKFEVLAAQEDGKIQIRSKMEINQVYFQSEEYANLREFINLVMEVQQSQIVLRLE